ncbi:hypothetical protein GDO86_015620 [Hymenochirus boettgeri]|uniref:Uncharacterized protein n=1 Tax=Hymenochirus boettgeri TaxID=247094 RepID=A0A8T2JY25_9PIPI|nr:hypothetical protein GDO86_015620 [Hymenochirus boettgeri]
MAQKLAQIEELYFILGTHLNTPKRLLCINVFWDYVECQLEVYCIILCCIGYVILLFYCLCLINHLSIKCFCKFILKYNTRLLH